MLQRCVALKIALANPLVSHITFRFEDEDNYKYEI